MTPPTTKKYAAVTLLDRITMTIRLLRMPFALAWAMIRSPFTKHTRLLTWKRVLVDQAFRSLVSTMNVPQIQTILGTTHGNCATWSKQTGVPIKTEEIGEDARLHWIKSDHPTKKVILYIHSGAFLASISLGAPSFLRYLQEQMKSQDKHVDIAILQYSLVPEGVYPTPLKQLTLAIEHLAGKGVEPRDISLIGDSAGGNLILQLFSHLLHPHPSIPRLDLGSPFRCAYLMSPWITLLDHRNNFSKHDATDIVPSRTLNSWGEIILKDVPESQLVYAEPSSAPSSWWEGVDKLVNRTFISVGGAECLKDETVAFADTLRPHCHHNFKFIVQQNGVHIDPVVNFLVGEKQPDNLTTLVAEWFAQDF